MAVLQFDAVGFPQAPVTRILHVAPPLIGFALIGGDCHAAHKGPCFAQILLRLIVFIAELAGCIVPVEEAVGFLPIQREKPFTVAHHKALPERYAVKATGE